MQLLSLHCNLDKTILHTGIVQFNDIKSYMLQVIDLYNFHQLLCMACRGSILLNLGWHRLFDYSVYSDDYLKPYNNLISTVGILNYLWLFSEE